MSRLRPRTVHYVLFLLVLVALVLRIFLLAQAPGILDGDEAVVGIQAERIAAGVAHPLPVFYYGQPYMGSLESYLAAGLFRLWGPSVLGLRAVPLVFALVLVLLTYDLARRVEGRRAALVAGLIAAAPPLYIGVWSLKARGGYIETLALGTGLLVVTHHLVYGLRGRVRWRDLCCWAFWGALAGFLFWLNPISLAYIVTGAGALAVAAARWHHRATAILAVSLVAGGMLVGGLPLWVDNIHTHGATFRYLSDRAGSTLPLVTRVSRATAYMFEAILPKLTGAWEPWTRANNPVLGVLVLVLYTAAAASLFAAGLRASRDHGHRLLFACGSVVIGLFCLGGFAEGRMLTLVSVDALSRHALALASVLPVAIGVLVSRLWPRRKLIAVAALLTLLVTTALGYVTIRPNEIFQSEYWVTMPHGERQLAAFLAAHRLRSVWLNDWAGYPLMFYTNERVATADYADAVQNTGGGRLPWATRQVESDPRAAYALVTPERHPLLEGLLRGRGVHFAQSRVGPYVVFWNLSKRVDPAAVAPGP